MEGCCTQRPYAQRGLLRAARCASGLPPPLTATNGERGAVRPKVDAGQRGRRQWAATASRKEPPTAGPDPTTPEHPPTLGRGWPPTRAPPPSLVWWKGAAHRRSSVGGKGARPKGAGDLLCCPHGRAVPSRACLSSRRRLQVQPVGDQPPTVGAPGGGRPRRRVPAVDLAGARPSCPDGRQGGRPSAATALVPSSSRATASSAPSSCRAMP